MLQGPQDVAGAAEIDRPAADKSDTLDAEEWELSTVPDEWKPAPLFKVLGDLLQYYSVAANLSLTGALSFRRSKTSQAATA